MVTNMVIKLGDKRQVRAKKNGVVRLGGVDIEAFFVPEFRISLLSVGQLDSHGYTSTFKSGICSITNTKGNRVLSGVLKEGLYVLATDGSALISEIRLLRARNPITLKIWHKRFAHLNYQDLRRILNPLHMQITNSIDDEPDTPFADRMGNEPITDPMDDQPMTDPKDNEPVTDPMDEQSTVKYTDSSDNQTTAPNNRKDAADRALQVVNKVITTHSDIEHPPFNLANITATNNLVFTVAPQRMSTTYEPYLAILEEALHEFPIASSRVSQQCTGFIIHSIPTTATPETVRTKIETTYPSLRKGQTPRWLTSPKRRQGKEASSMVVTLIGEMTKKSLGATNLALFNRECNIAEYISFGPSTQCNKCQQFGHPTQCCTANHHTCAVCAQSHATRSHPCAIENCKAGHSCNHPRSAAPTASNHTKPPTETAPPM